MSERLTTDEVRDLFVKRWWEGGGRPTEYGPKFDTWLESVKQEAYDEGYAECEVTQAQQKEEDTMSEQERMSLEQQELASLMEVGEAAWRWAYTKGLGDSLDRAEWELVEAVEEYRVARAMQRDARGGHNE